MGAMSWQMKAFKVFSLIPGRYVVLGVAVLFSMATAFYLTMERSGEYGIEVQPLPQSPKALLSQGQTENQFAEPQTEEMVNSAFPGESLKGATTHVLDRWVRHPRGLGSAVLERLEGVPTAGSALVAEQLAACAAIAGYIESARVPLNDPPEFRSSASDQNAKERVAKYMNIEQDCSAVVGDKRNLAHQLFERAALAGVVGAAAQSNVLKNQNPELAKALLADARAGDLWSIFYVGFMGEKILGLSSQEMHAYAHSLLRAQSNSNREIAGLAAALSGQLLDYLKVAYTTERADSSSVRMVVAEPSFLQSKDVQSMRLSKDIEQSIAALEAQRRTVGRFGVIRGGP